MSLEGKVALVTGGGRGIGKALALGLARQNCKVVVASTTMANNLSVANAIEEAGGESLPLLTDVASEDSVKRTVEQVLGRFDRLDILVNNAALKTGFFPQQSRALVDVPLPQWQRMLDVNVTGSLLCARYCVLAMSKNGSGSIINLTSGASLAPRAGDGVYSMTKAAINIITKVMAEELKDRNIAVNAIMPGFTPAQGTDLSRLGPETRGRAVKPDTSLPLVIYLASQEPVTVTGQIIDALEWNQSHSFGGIEKWSVAAPP